MGWGRPQESFVCKNKRCIFKSWTCNKEDECGDRSDETTAACGDECQDLKVRDPNARDVGRVEFIPTFTCNNGQCITSKSDNNELGRDKDGRQIWLTPSVICDGKDDCGDNSDEENCG